MTKLHANHYDKFLTELSKGSYWWTDSTRKEGVTIIFCRLNFECAPIVIELEVSSEIPRLAIPQKIKKIRERIYIERINNESRKAIKLINDQADKELVDIFFNKGAGK